MFSFFFSIEHPIALVVNLTIILLGAWGMIEIFMASKILAREQGELRKFKHSAKDLTEASQFRQPAENLSSEGILRQRLKTLDRLHSLGDEVHHESLAALVVGKLDEQVSVARWAASTVVLIGLGGTLVGLSVAVWSARDLIEGAIAQEDATRALLGTFSGLQTAFSTTLSGLVVSVLLGFLVSHFRRRQSRYVVELEQFTLERLLPRFRTSPSLAMANAARTLAEVEGKLETSLSEVIDQLSTRGRALSSVVEQGLSQVVETVHKRGVALMTTVDKSMTDLVQDVREGHVELVGKYDSAHANIARLLGDPSQDQMSIADSIAALQQGVEAINHTSAAFGRMTPAIEEAIARQVDRQTRDLHDTMHSYTSRMADGAAQYETGVRESMDALRVLVQQMQTQLATAQTQQLDRFGRLIEERIGDLTVAITSHRTKAEELDHAVQGLVAAANKLSVADRESELTHLAKIQEGIELIGERLKEGRPMGAPSTPPPASIPEFQRSNVPSLPGAESLATASKVNGRVAGNLHGPSASQAVPAASTKPDPKFSRLLKWFGGGN